MKHITTADVIHVMDEKNKPAMTVSCGGDVYGGDREPRHTGRGF